MKKSPRYANDTLQPGQVHSSSHFRRQASPSTQRRQRS